MVNSDRAAALALARHAQDVTDSVVARARKASPRGNNSNTDSVAALRLCFVHQQLFIIAL